MMMPARVLSRLSDPRLLHQDAIRPERVYRPIALLGFSLTCLYAGVTWQFAARKLMWNDELYTYYVATQPTLRDVWGALTAGGEQTPPLFYAITRVSIALFGTSALALRVPEIVGFWMMGACIYLFVRRRTAAGPALFAAAMPLVTSAYWYGFDARAYGLELGFVALTLYCWQSAGLRPRRWMWLAALTLSLAATASIHYYGIFVLIPLGIGELSRTVEKRRVDVAVWCAFLTAVLPLLLQLPIIRAGAGYSGTFWSPPQWVNVPDFYHDLLAPAIVPAAAILALTFFAFSDGRPRPDSAHFAPPPASEVLAVAVLAVIPLFEVIAAKLVTGAFVNRYAVSAVVGIAALTGFGANVGFRRYRALSIASIAIVIGWFGFSAARELKQPTGDSMPVSRISIERPAEWVASSGKADLPVVIADPHSFAVLSHYADPSLKRRIVYLADPAAALSRLGHNSVERGMVDLLGPWFHMNVVPFEPYIASHPAFLLYGDFVRLSFLNWILPELQDRGYRIELLDRAGDNMLLLASRDHEH